MSLPSLGYCSHQVITGFGSAARSLVSRSSSAIRPFLRSGASGPHHTTSEDVPDWTSRLASLFSGLPPPQDSIPSLVQGLLMTSEPPPDSQPSAVSTSGAGPSLASLQWGKWEKSNGGMQHYSLEVAQHPIRARMCGFGDKDRRPLAPAAIARMIVRNEQNQIIPAEDIELDFFLVTCDLWSADGQMEVNLVRNPSSSTSTRRRNREQSGQSGSDDGEFAAAGSSRDLAREDVQLQPMHQAMAQGLPPSDVLTGTWSPSTYPSPAQGGWNVGGAYPDSSQRPLGFPEPPYNVQSGMHTPSSQGWGPDVGQASSVPPYDSRGTPSYTAETPTNSSQQAMQVPSSRPDREKDPSSSYTRTLVGPLSANAARLHDDKKQLGIFFTFQDLSVRTEGTFRLRLRLVNVGAPPAPNRGALRVHEHVSPVLAQTFTDAFTVFSAKKFPGVPAMTSLSLEFGKQGQKLPLRNRPGSTGRAKTRGGDSDEEESGAESEEAV